MFTISAIVHKQAPAHYLEDWTQAGQLSFLHHILNLCGQQNTLKIINRKSISIEILSCVIVFFLL